MIPGSFTFILDKSFNDASLKEFSEVIRLSKSAVPPFIGPPGIISNHVCNLKRGSAIYKIYVNIVIFNSGITLAALITPCTLYSQSRSKSKVKNAAFLS